MAQFVLFLAPTAPSIYRVFANFAAYGIICCHANIPESMQKNWLPSLRATLLADSLVCFLCGGVLFGWPLLLSALFTITDLTIAGTSFGVFLRGLGAVVVLIGAGVYATAQASVVSRMAVLLIVLVEVIWMLGNFLLLTYCHQSLSTGGIAFFAGGAFVVFVFMVLELMGLQKMVSVGSPQRSPGQP
jgi:hypothetical protein